MKANKSNKIAVIFQDKIFALGLMLLHGCEIPLDRGDIRQSQAVN